MIDDTNPKIFANPGVWVQPGYSIVGTCSICGGAVTVPTVWAGVIPPTPTCTSCGAIKKQSYGPVIEMTPVLKSTRTIFGPRNYENTGGVKVDNPDITFGSNSIFPPDSK